MKPLNSGNRHPTSAPVSAKIIRPDWPFKNQPKSARHLSLRLSILLAILLFLPFAGVMDAHTEESAAGTGIQSPATSPGVKNWTSVEGKVSEVIGNKFLLDTGSERLLVTTGPDWYHRLTVPVGENVIVEGQRDEEGLDAFRIVRSDGTMTEIRPTDSPPAWATERIPPWAGQGRQGGRDGFHRSWRPFAGGSSARSGNLSVQGNNENAPTIADAALRQIVEAAGYEFLGDARQRFDHIELFARNPQGEIVELRIRTDGKTDGEIVRERHLRGFK